MKALTVIQPYAELIARGVKPIENRRWPTAYRGPLAIHAGKNRSWLDEGDALACPQMAFGAFVALATLVDCVKLDDLPTDLTGHAHAEGPYCWILQNVRRIVPIPYRGAQGLWVPDADTLEILRVVSNKKE